MARSAGHPARGRNSASARGGPRRLTKESRIPADAGRRASRSAAGDASCSCASGRIIHSVVSLPCAARCNRRSASGRICACHRISAPQLPLRRICSALHSASALRAALIHNSRSCGRPQTDQAAVCGTCGGCSSAMRPCLAIAASAGRSSCISPMPGCASSSSIRAERGQPPPGNSRSSASAPDGVVAARGAAIWLARHSRCGMRATTTSAAAETAILRGLDETVGIGISGKLDKPRTRCPGERITVCIYSIISTPD